VIPKIGTITPIRIREEAGMNKTVLAKRTAVEVIVVKPGMVTISEHPQRNVTKQRTVGKEEPRCQVLEGVP
jgi:hypothetical protein